MRAAGWKIVTLSEEYGVQQGQHVSDTAWISEQTAAGRVLVTSDARILSDPLERQAIVSARALMFTFPTARLRSDEHFGRLMTHRERIAGIVSLEDIPAAYALYEHRVSRILP
ncbi:hypothetical protein [Paramicrobacterium chengjingii]|uniref:PIN-like domain-containing protein n=1 Tax=Paramicrobacterium chengjingii TaxID=2769067 RepID=UPI00331303F1